MDSFFFLSTPLTYLIFFTESMEVGKTSSRKLIVQSEHKKPLRKFFGAEDLLRSGWEKAWKHWTIPECKALLTTLIWHTRNKSQHFCLISKLAFLSAQRICTERVRRESWPKISWASVFCIRIHSCRNRAHVGLHSGLQVWNPCVSGTSPVDWFSRWQIENWNSILKIYYYKQNSLTN